MTHVLHLDFETRSPVDIGRCGAYKYIEHEEFAPLLLAYALDDDDVQVHDFIHDGSLPSELEWMICNSDIKKSAHNAAFERTVLQRMTRCYQPPEEWIDTMMLSAYCGLPLGLDAVCKAMHFSEDKQKMSEGKKLIRWFCNPTPAGKFRKPEDAPEKWKTFIEYCRQDVVTEREIYNQLQKWLPGESEFELWSLDQRMNDKGIRIDRQLATNAMAFDERYKAELTEKAIALTGIKNPSSVTQIKQYLKEKEGLEVETLNKTALPDVIASLKTDEAKEFLDIRIDLAKSSTKKYESMVRCACADDHVRGTLQFYGGHTGRWAGRLLQVQNFSKNKMPDIDNARYFVREGDYDTTEMLYGSVSSTLSELTRTGIIPEEGCHFIVADFSAIEARVTAALAKEEWRLKSFRDGKDIYCESASAMFHVPVVKHGINGELRQKGKVAELACIAEDELVLTDFGLVPIQDVTTDMKVWDGENWVRHEGVIYQGEKEVIEYDGLRATADHPVYVEGHRGTVPFETAKASGACLVKAGSGWHSVRVVGDYLPNSDIQQGLAQRLCTREVPWMRNSKVAKLDKPYSWNIKRMPTLQSTETDTTVVGQKTDRTETEVRESERSSVPTIRKTWYQVLLRFRNRSRTLSDGLVRREPHERLGDRPNRQRWKLRARESTTGHSCGQQSEQEEYRSLRVGSSILAVCRDCCEKVFGSWLFKGRDYRTGEESCPRQAEKLERNPGKVRVYDIRNAGPNHRFTVSGKLVHNCGFGGSVGALKAFGADKMGLTDEEMMQIVDNWRASSPNIVNLWKALESAAIRAVTRRGTFTSSIGNIIFRYDPDVLWMVLPSGRRMAYWEPRYEEAKDPKRYGKTLSYMYLNQTTKKWERIETFAGRICENLVQSVARDCLKEALLNLTYEGYDIRMHVHDEVIINEPDGSGRTVEDVIRVMTKPVEWLPNLPLDADGYECPYYIKD